MQVMLLAAGRGKRMRPLTDTCPKPLLPVAGKPLIVHHLLKCKAAGLTNIVINHAWLGEMLEAELKDGSAFGVQIQWSAEQTALETAGGIVHALPLLDDRPFLVINSDIWTDADYRQFIHIPSHPQGAHLWLTDNPPHHAHGDFSLQAGWVSHAPCLTYTGIGVFSPKLFQSVPPGPRSLAGLLRDWITKGMVSGSHLESVWWDVGTPERLATLARTLQSN